jgi:hypothetical protein
MSSAPVLVAFVLYLGGAVALFRAATARGRLQGIAALALGGLALSTTAGPDRGTAVVVAAVGGVTLTGLLLVARAMEHTSQREDGTDLRIDVDPLRWR